MQMAVSPKENIKKQNIKYITLHNWVESFCEILDYATLYLDCDDRVVVIIAKESAEQILKHWQSLEYEIPPWILLINRYNNFPEK